MKIAYLGYWSVNDALTHSVIFPRLEVLATFDVVEEIIFFSIERTVPVDAVMFENKRIKHVPLVSQSRGSVWLTKFSDFTEFPRQIQKVIQDQAITLFIANSPLAGAVVWRAMRHLKISLVVECYEPHADYMLESGVWRGWDPRYLILRYFEKLQRKKAKWLMTVSHHFTNRLIAQGVSASKVITVPNSVNLEAFKFDPGSRQIVRSRYGIPEDAYVGIYVGKFGDIYYEEEAFELFGKTSKYFKDKLHVIILTSHNHEIVTARLVEAGVPPSNVQVTSAPHHEVPSFLSAADFAWSTIKPAPSRIFCCPIKDGEYWANGLPILLETGIGDDSDIIVSEGGGVILNMKSPTAAFESLASILAIGREELATSIQKIAERHRNPKTLLTAYERILGSL